MAIEIEIKAWVDDEQHCRKKLKELAHYAGNIHKIDHYWQKSPETGTDNDMTKAPRVRIRQEGTQHTVTFKTKELRLDTEVNEEYEFIVSDPEAFSLLLTKIGYSPWQEKIKTGEKWIAGDMTIELCMVEKLGLFLELEILAKDKEQQTVDAARSSLYTMLQKLEIPEKNIETRYYTELLSKDTENT